MHPLADDERLRSLDPGGAHVLEPVPAQQLDGRVGARAHVGEVLGIGADARDAHELFELGARLVDHVVDGCDRGVHWVRSMQSGSGLPEARTNRRSVLAAACMPAIQRS